MIYKKVLEYLTTRSKSIGYECEEEEADFLKENGYVMLYGASDDLAEFRGAVDDEIGCFEGGRILENGHYYIDAVWSDTGISWTYNTNIPHMAIPIFEDDGVFCIAIIFDERYLKERRVDNG